MHEELDPARYAMLPDVVDRYRSWLPRRAEDPRSVFLVADTRPGLAGFLIATIETNIPIYQLEEFGFIHDVWVDPRHRRGGVVVRARGRGRAPVQGDRRETGSAPGNRREKRRCQASLRRLRLPRGHGGHAAWSSKSEAGTAPVPRGTEESPRHWQHPAGAPYHPPLCH